VALEEANAVNSNAIIVGFGAAFFVLCWIVMIRKFAAPFSGKRSIKRLLREFKAGRIPITNRTKHKHLRITFDSTGCAVSNSDLRQAWTRGMQWTEVVRIAAYKQDFWSFDRICLLLIRTDDFGLELNEEMDGWVEFCQAIPRFLPGCVPFHDWIWKVASPAFASNPTELYHRASNQSVVMKV